MSLGREQGDHGRRDRLVQQQLRLAETLALRYRGRGEPVDDLTQVARLALVEAAERFDPARGVPFHTYARAVVTGSLRQHLRDRGWVVHVPRSLRGTNREIALATESLRHDLRREPSIDEVAAWLRLTRKQVLEAIDLRTAFRPVELRDGEPDGQAHTISSADPETVVDELLAKLPARDRELVYRHYVEDQSAAEIAERVGLSERHVRRLLRASIGRLRRLVQR